MSEDMVQILGKLGVLLKGFFFWKVGEINGRNDYWVADATGMGKI